MLLLLHRESERADLLVPFYYYVPSAQRSRTKIYAKRNMSRFRPDSGRRTQRRSRRTAPSRQLGTQTTISLRQNGQRAQDTRTNREHYLPSGVAVFLLCSSDAPCGPECPTRVGDVLASRRRMQVSDTSVRCAKVESSARSLSGTWHGTQV